MQKKQQYENIVYTQCVNGLKGLLSLLTRYIRRKINLLDCYTIYTRSIQNTVPPIKRKNMMIMLIDGYIIVLLSLVRSVVKARRGG